MAYSAPAPPVDPEKDRDRRIVRQTARLTAIAGLVAGLVGAIAGVGGAYITANAQIESTRDEFQLTQRQAAYAQFYNDANKMDTNLDGEPSIGVEPLNEEEMVVVENDRRAVVADFGLLQLVASPRVEVAAREVLNALVERWAYERHGFCDLNGWSSQMCGAYTSEQPPFDWRRYERSIVDFQQAARADLGQQD